jgi:phosphate starvation-inducible membrane PsiE
MEDSQPHVEDMRQEHREPSLEPAPTRAEELLSRAYERAESVLMSVISLVLIAFVVVALFGVIQQVNDPLFVRHQFTEASLKGLDAAFLVIILLELLHTTLSRGPISQQLQEFLVIGITAMVRHSLELAAGGGNARDVVINLVITAVAAFVLVGALWLVRQQLRADREAEKRWSADTDRARTPERVEQQRS